MKKIISLIMAVMLVAGVGVSAFAATGEDDSKLDNRIQSLEERQQRIAELSEQNEARQAELATKAEEFEAFRQSLSENRQLVLDNAEANLDLAAETNQLRLELLKALDAIRDSGAQLPEETAAQLEEYNAQVKALADTLKETKGQIKDIKEAYRGYVRDKDYAAMDTAFAEIAAVQEYRHDLMVQLNALLVEMNGLV